MPSLCSKSFIGNKGAVALAHALTGCTELESLYLRYTNPYSVVVMRPLAFYFCILVREKVFKRFIPRTKQKIDERCLLPVK